MKLLKKLFIAFVSFSTLSLGLSYDLKDYPNPWSSDIAIQKATDQSQHPSQNYYQLCDHAQANFYGWGGSGFPSALEHWNGIGNIDKHPNDWSAPAGAFQFWGGDQYGHIALSMGGGKIASNDILRQGKIDIVDASLISQKWGLKYLGWTTPTFMGHAYGTSPLIVQQIPNCWEYGQNKESCLKQGCQWCSLGGYHGTFCAPPGSKNCLASSLSVNNSLQQCLNLKEIECRSHPDKCNWTGPLGGCMNRYLESPNMDCTNFSEQMCSQNFQWCNWGGPLEDCMNRYRQTSSEAFQSSEISNVQTTGKCLEELKDILECGDNPICLDLQTAKIIGECVSVVCPHVPWWAQGLKTATESEGAACLVYCAHHKEVCNRGLTSINFVEMSDFYNLSGDRQCLMVGAKALYDQRANEIYTGDVNKRWDGIFDNVHPPSAPKYSDCSSAVSWIYWTCYGSGPDFINGENWNDGYTGTLDQHGTKISLGNAQPGDLVFYGNPIDHVAIYIGSGRVVSHGSDPVCNCDVHYRSDLNQVRTYLN